MWYNAPKKLPAVGLVTSRHLIPQAVNTV